MESIDYITMDETFLETQLGLFMAELYRIKSNASKAQKEYVSKNRDKINAIQRAYYHRHKNNPYYKERKKIHNKAYRERKYLTNLAEEENIQPIYIENGKDYCFEPR